MEKWIGKVAVVTGVSGGIGKAIAKSFISAGIKVIGLDINKIGLDEEGGKNLNEVIYRQCDITDIESVNEAFKWIEEKYKAINILVNSAGIFKIMDLLGDDDMVMEKVNTVMNINFIGMLSCIREAFRSMKKSDDFGIIINICSVAGEYPHFYDFSMNVYAPSKVAVKSLSEILRQELVSVNNKKIRVANISPGSVRTPMSTIEGREAGVQLEPEDVAQAITFLLSTPYNVNISQLTIKPVGERL